LVSDDDPQPTDFDAVLAWVHAGRRGTAPVEIPSTPWVPLTQAVMLILAYGEIKIETKILGGTPWLTEGGWRALNVFLGNAASIGQLHLRGRQWQPDRVSEMQDISPAYFSKERAFHSNSISRLPHRNMSAVVSERQASMKLESDWVDVHVNRDELCNLLNLPRPKLPAAESNQHKKIKRRGGRKPGPYVDQLRSFLEWYHKNQPGGLITPTLKQLAADARRRLERDKVKRVPRSRSAFEAVIKKIKAEILSRNLSIIRR
jgi:hypothetical protein